jgi:signal recognition particle subunit SRP19
MSRDARIEEISDSDSDPQEMDIDDFKPTDIIRPADIAQPNRAPAPAQAPALQPQFRAPSTGNGYDKEKMKSWQCIYPVYFDKTRSRTEGRRVGKELAVENPLAREIADAVSLAGLNVAYEAGAMHPKDWANPGRVKVCMKENGKLVNPKVKNSNFLSYYRLPPSSNLWLEHHLYILVSIYLRTNPTNERTPLRVPIAGLPRDKIPGPPNVPRGWKMGQILPLHSPAVSGGGVSENMFKDMMSEMQAHGGTPPPQIAGLASSMEASTPPAKSKPKKKDKKKSKA